MSVAPSGPKLHPLHRLWRMLPMRARRRILVQATGVLAPRPANPAPRGAGGIAVAGELAQATGLGESARLMRAGLDRIGIPNWGLALPPLHRGTDSEGRWMGRPAIPPDLPAAAPLIIHVNAPMLPLALLRIGRQVAAGRRVVGYWAWELSRVPAEWRVGVRLVHEVWVPSRFVAEALAPIMPGRIRVVPHPLAASPPRPSALDRAAFSLPADALVTLVSFNLASSFARKNPLAAIAAHRLAFGDRADRILLLKVGNPDFYPEDFATLRAAAAEAPNIRIETRGLPPADNAALTQAADIVLSLHRAEGFGLVPAEAMWLGRPTIATGWSGNMDFMAEGASALVGYRLVPAIDPRGVFEAKGGQWAEPDMMEAARWLTRLAEDPALRAEIGGRGAALVRERLDVAGLAEAAAGLGLSGPGLS